ncbi:ABC transporter substrate-binding protein, partial [Azotobacter beijerinckii]|uniref:ABC transporter substrate-binding protein n=1 Tax=Azotobacter beijerinckii TaxID=170623 RepID=UPI0029543D29
MHRRPTALLLASLLAGAVQATPSSLVVCTEGSPEGFDIVQYTAAVSADASAETVFDRLLRFAPGGTGLLPALAERWEVSADGLEYTFQLRRGVRFQRTPWFVPSREFNADDVIWSFRRQIDPQHPWHRLSPRGFPYAESMAVGELIRRIDRLDDHRVRFVLRYPEAPFLANLAMGFASIYSAEYADRLLAAGTPERLNSQPLGTGPFVFERYEKDAQVRFRRNPDYWDGAPAIERLIFAITPEPNVRVQKLKAGDCQIALSPRPVDLPGLRKDARIEVLEDEPLLTAYIGINTRHPPLDDVRVRQALNLAVDKAAYLRAQFGEGGASPAVAPYPPSLWGSDPTLAAWPHDPARAERK